MYKILCQIYTLYYEEKVQSNIAVEEGKKMVLLNVDQLHYLHQIHDSFPSYAKLYQLGLGTEH